MYNPKWNYQWLPKEITENVCSYPFFFYKNLSSPFPLWLPSCVALWNNYKHVWFLMSAPHLRNYFWGTINLALAGKSLQRLLQVISSISLYSCITCATVWFIDVYMFFHQWSLMAQRSKRKQGMDLPLSKIGFKLIHCSFQKYSKIHAQNTYDHVLVCILLLLFHLSNFKVLNSKLYIHTK